MSDTLIISCDTCFVSDGHHTFQELYDHKHLLWILILKLLKDSAFKTYCDAGGVRMDNWFIAGLNTEFGQLTYHLPEIYWNHIKAPALPRNEGYDNHTSEDVLTRLSSLIEQ
ncbi:hypothetical protein [Bacterioplanoides sp.]|uniref:WDGH domain-containing protein n=1 Tax=Bacterioplanoides sp. TaxID=2066072 RepID=UPI003B5CC01C